MKKCSHEDSRIKCSECDATICSNCLVQCPVGFRCQSCVGSKNKGVKSASVQPLWLVATKAFAASVFVGLVAGWLIPFMAIPYISCFICLFMGLYSGRWLVQHVDRSLGARTAPTIVFGVLLGMLLGPLHVIPLALVSVITDSVSSQGTTIFDGLNGGLSLLFDPVCFFAGILRPTVWGEY